MPQKFQRKDFLKLLALANLGLYTKPLLALTKKFPGSFLAASSNNVLYYKDGEAQYETLRKGFNKRFDRHPLIIALCSNTVGVAEAIQYAIANKLPVAVKSGGHCMEGFSGNNGGMVINLSQLKSIGWLNGSTIKVGPGCTLSALYDELLPKKKIIPGGSCGTVGIGGLTLGGGYGLLSRNFGLTCDSLTSVTMVDGNAVTRSSVTEPDLLWACKGGGNGNFGVITEMTFQLHKAPASMQSWRFKTYKVTAPKAKEIFKQWFESCRELPNTCFSACLLNGKTMYILLTNTAKNDSAVDHFIKTMSGISGKTTHSLSQPIAKALKVFYGEDHPVSFKNASSGLYKDFADIENCIEKVLQTVIDNPGMIYQVNLVGGNVQDPVKEMQSSFPHRAYTFFSELQSYWQTEKQAKRLIQAFQSVQDIFQQNGIVAQYRNYPDINFTKWDTAYYGANYAKLQQLKSTYDPNDRVQHDQSIRLRR